VRTKEKENITSRYREGSNLVLDKERVRVADGVVDDNLLLMR